MACMKVKKKDSIVLTGFALLWLVIKLYLASQLELGNDEVYYWLYAKYPDLSHFDHPPMIGWIIQLFSLNLHFDSELFLRLGPIVLSAMSLPVLFFLISKLYNRDSAWLGVLLYAASIYFNSIAGWMVLPDGPQVFFILLAMYYMVPVVLKTSPGQKDDLRMVAGGFLTGLAFLSKYHALFLWFGLLLFILFYRRVWLKRASLYISGMLTILCMLPVIIWNCEHDFISFTFHSGRVGFFEQPFRFFKFGQFTLGQFLYQNPINMVIYLLAIVGIFKKRDNLKERKSLLFLFLSLPIIFIFSLIALKRSTLPHWTGPAFLPLIILVAGWSGSLKKQKRKNLQIWLLFSNFLVLIFMSLSFLQINYGIIPMPNNKVAEKFGKDDISLDMYGWHQAGRKTSRLFEQKSISPDSVLFVSHKWFPAAHIHYYIARPMKNNLITTGSLKRIHKYHWINRHYLPVEKDKRLIYVTNSRYYCSPEKHFSSLEVQAFPLDTISIQRKNIKVWDLYLYELEGELDIFR